MYFNWCPAFTERQCVFRKRDILKVFYIHRIRVVLKVPVFQLFNFISECMGALSNIHNSLLTPRVDLIGEHKQCMRCTSFDTTLWAIYILSHLEESLLGRVFNRCLGQCTCNYAIYLYIPYTHSVWINLSLIYVTFCFVLLWTNRAI